MNNLSLVLAVAFILLFIAAAIWLTQLERKRLRQNVELFAGIGFQPLLKPDPQLSEQIIAHYRRGRGVRGARSGVRVIGAPPLQVKNVFQRSHPDGDLLVYDIWDRAAEVGQVAQGAVAIIRHGACLPYFKSMPWARAAGWRAQLRSNSLQKPKARERPFPSPNFRNSASTSR